VVHTNLAETSQHMNEKNIDDM